MTDQKDAEQNTSSIDNTGAFGETVPEGSRKPRRAPKKNAAKPEGGPDGEAPKAAVKPKARRGSARSAPGDSSGTPAEFADISSSPASEAGVPVLMENEGRSGKSVARSKSSGRGKSAARKKNSDSPGTDAVALAGEEVAAGVVGELFAEADDAPAAGVGGVRKETRTQRGKGRSAGKQASAVSSREKKNGCP